MIFDELVAETCERLNLTSDEAKSRVGRELNNRYRRMTSSIGLETSRRTQVSKTATVGSQSVTFSGIEKVSAVIDKSTANLDIALAEVTMDELHVLPIKTEPPRHFAIDRMHYNTVTIKIDCVPATTFTLYADGIVNLTTLAGNSSPDFPESYHEILIFGAMADEYRKMEKVDLAHDCEQDYERRLSDLRMYIAKSGYLDIYQGKYKSQSFRWTRDNALLWNQ